MSVEPQEILKLSILQMLSNKLVTCLHLLFLFEPELRSLVNTFGQIMAIDSKGKIANPHFY